MQIVRDISPHLTVARTQAQIEDQGLTYNQSGVSYNDSRYLYGGLAGRQDVFPAPVLSLNLRPGVLGFGDLSTTPGIHTPIGLLLILTHHKL